MGTTRLERYSKIYISLLLIAFVFVVYGRSLNFGLYWDDNHHARPWGLKEVLGTFAGPFDPLGIEPPYFRPLKVVSFALDWLVWGYNAWGYRLTNLLLYSLAAILLYIFLRRLAAPRMLAFGAAMFYVVVPANAATAVYISERGDSLATIFVLAGLISFDSYRKTAKRRWLVGANLAVILAFGSKEVGAALPLLLLMYSLWFSWIEITKQLPTQEVAKPWRVLKTLWQKLNWRWFLVANGIPFLILICLLIYRVLVLPKDEAIQVYDASRNPLIGYLSTVFQTFKAVPWNVEFWSALVPLIPLAVALIFGRKSKYWQIFIFGLGWVLVTSLTLATLGRIDPRLLFLQSVGYAICVAVAIFISFEAISAIKGLRFGLVLLFITTILTFSTAYIGNVGGQDWYAPYSQNSLDRDEDTYKDLVIRAKYPEHNILIIEQKLKQAGRL